METQQSASARNICGKTVRALRIGSKLSQDQLAVKCQLIGWDVDRKLISKIEIGIREITDAEIRILAEVLGVSVEKFFEFSKAEVKRALKVAER